MEDEKVQTGANILIGLGLIIMIVGMYVSFAMPYEITSSYTWYNPISSRYETSTSTVTIHGHPMGYLVDGFGFFLLLIGLIAKAGKKPDRREPI
jgi:hypothetical protein